MATSDGITYYLNNLPMSAGRVKFRADDMWYITGSPKVQAG